MDIDFAHDVDILHLESALSLLAIAMTGLYPPGRSRKGMACFVFPLRHCRA
jgi:hypothetical protein